MSCNASLSRRASLERSVSNCLAMSAGTAEEDPGEVSNWRLERMESVSGAGDPAKTVELGDFSVFADWLGVMGIVWRWFWVSILGWNPESWSWGMLMPKVCARWAATARSAGCSWACISEVKRGSLLAWSFRNCSCWGDIAPASCSMLAVDWWPAHKLARLKVGWAWVDKLREIWGEPRLGWVQVHGSAWHGREVLTGNPALDCVIICFIIKS